MSTGLIKWREAASGRAWHYDLCDGEVCFARDITMGNQGGPDAIRKHLAGCGQATVQVQPRLPFSPRARSRQLGDGNADERTERKEAQ